MLDVLFKNVRALTMDDAQPELQNGYVGVKDARIAYLGEDEPKEDAAKTVDCQKKLMLPGLVNAHCHIAALSMRGLAEDMKLGEWLETTIFPTERKLDRKSVYTSALLGMAAMIRNGVTTAADMYFYLAETARAALECGMNLNTCNALVAFDDENCVFENDRCFTDSMEVLRDYHMANAGQIRLDASIHAEYTSGPRGWDFITKLAREYGLGMQLHLSETKDEQQRCVEKRGMTPAAVFEKHGVFKSRTAAAHCVWLSAEDMDILHENDVTAVYNPVSNLKLASGVADVVSMQAHGVRVAIGTDGASSNNAYDILRDLRTGVLLQKNLSSDPTAMPAREALKLATVNGAYALGREGETGMLKQGMYADLILLKLGSPSLAPVYDPYAAAVYAASGADVCLTMARGRVLCEDGELKTIDVERALYDAENYVKPRVLGC